MLFNSSAFLMFLLVSVPLYCLLPLSRRKLALLALSYIFYGIWSVPYLLLLAAVTGVAYVSGLWIGSARTEGHRKRALGTSLALLLSVLILFKYAGVLGALAQLAGVEADAFTRLLVPLGISYYTFKLISYVMDVYWDKIPCERDPAAFALYPAFFPQILSGPIQRPADFLPQIHQPAPNDPGLITSGLRLMLFGYFKKVVVADSLGPFVDQVYADPSGTNSLCVLLACYAYVFQLYADFSGFTDIAIGTGRLFGIRSPKNFSMPFYAPNLQEFWRRWHMTLTRWLADYVFTPLRMTFRSWGSLGIVLAITVNFAAIGLWHGATLPFLAFGLLHAVYMCVSVFTLPARNAFFDRRPGWARARIVWAPLITFQLWTLSEIFFRADSLDQAGRVLGALLDLDAAKPWVFGYGKEAFLWSVFLILVMEAVHWVQSKGRWEFIWSRKWAAPRWAVYYAMTFAVLHQCAGAARQFIYFKF
jgi:alginate O-acetyltransferase complex protein AlgI